MAPQDPGTILPGAAAQPPDPHGRVVAGRGQRLPVGAEGDAEDGTDVAPEDPLRLVRGLVAGRDRLRVPDPDRAVLPARATVDPSCENATPADPAVMAAQVALERPGGRSQILTRPLASALAIRVPARLNARP